MADERTSIGITPLMLAAQSNPNAAVITVLLKAGARVGDREIQYGFTPLLFAAEANPNPEIVSVLLEAGAMIDDKDKIGRGH